MFLDTGSRARDGLSGEMEEGDRLCAGNAALGPQQTCIVEAAWTPDFKIMMG